MSFPINDKYWVNAAEFLQKNIQAGDRVVGFDEFEEKCTGFVSYESIIESSSNDFQWVIIHKGMVEDLEYAFLDKVVNECNPVFANEVFVVFTKHTSMVALNHDFIHLQNFWEKVNLMNNLYAKLKNSLEKNLQNKSKKNEVYFNIKDIALLTRTELELNCRKMSQTVYIGNKTILCRVLSKYIFYCDTEDTDIVPHLAINGYWESWITQAMARVLKKGWKCIDIGANHGYYSVLMGDAVGSSGCVMAVEPNPRVARLLKQTIEVNGFAKQAIVVEKAIADVDRQVVKLVIPNGKGINATIARNAIESDNVVEVETITLDSLTTDWSNVDFVKIDAEGAEERIWYGMRETVRKNENITIIMEFNCSRYLDPKMFIQDIQASGFELHHIDYDSQIKKLTVDQCLTERPQEDWMLFLQKLKKNYSIAEKNQGVLNVLNIDSQVILDTVITTNNQQSNLNFFNNRLLSTADAVRLDIKTLGYEYARSLREQLTISTNLSPQKINLQSKACQQNDMESDWFFYWCQQIKIPVVYHRKLWEFCYILQALYEYDLLTPGRKGLGFGCGEEPLPSILAAYDIAITATDLDSTASAALGWIETNQNMSSGEKIFRPELCTKELFNKNVSLKYVDMNAIPAYLEGKYDFCWSACALEHLGSIKNGLLFIENSLKTLVPGGISIQTTEFNYLEEEETIDNYGTVLFRKKDFEEIAKKLTAAGHQVAPLDFNIGSRVLDRFIDLPPYNSKVHELAQEAHLKLLIDGFASTSFGIIIRKAM